MARLWAAMRSNPHVINYVALSAAFLGPVMYYASGSGPSSAQLEETLTAAYAEDVRRGQVASARIGHFWGATQAPGHAPARDMDAVYSSLLRAGAGSQARHHHLSGAAAATASAADAAYGRERATLLSAAGISEGSSGGSGGGGSGGTSGSGSGSGRGSSGTGSSSAASGHRPATVIAAAGTPSPKTTAATVAVVAAAMRKPSP